MPPSAGPWVTSPIPNSTNSGATRLPSESAKLIVRYPVRYRAARRLAHLAPERFEDVCDRPAETVDWGLRQTGVPQVWTVTRGRGIRVGVLDTGVAPFHPDLQPIARMKDFTLATQPEWASDDTGHGTHCAGIVCARANGRGVIGVAPEAELYVAKVIRGDESDAKSVAAGIRWMVDEGVRVINMSFAAEKSYPPIRQAVTKALNAGCYLVAAAGNEPGGPFTGSTVRYPARYDGVIAVGSVALVSNDPSLPLGDRINVSGLSATGQELDLVAPGVRVLSTYPPDKYAVATGTSQAGAFVAGVVALVLAKHVAQGGETPVETPAQMVEHLRRSAMDLEQPGFDPRSGFGLR
ncbi:MAG: S8 family peptidase [Planctomycetota bacterium]|nr:S8 family peptidase [Planctomycetota bacterium]